MLLNNRNLLITWFAFLMSLPVLSQNDSLDMVSFIYEEYGVSSYATTLRTVNYKQNETKYVLSDFEKTNSTEKIPRIIDKALVDEFVENLVSQRKSHNVVSFISKDVDSCLTFVKDK